ncbi:MAG: MBL fold metallo-hydrolase [Thermoleophilaceae bacterium]|nr:MBL fold metallo-hydrolase [Thermoleophilaceae bacterium]
MREIAPELWLLDGTPKDNRNVYVAGDVLIDAGMNFDKGRILKQIEGRSITAHALTHAHVDHYGASHAICDQLGLPLWCGTLDVEAVEEGKNVGRGGRKLPGPHKHKVSKAIGEGDEVAGFTVLDVPGHSPGHVAYWRESDRTLICGDVMWGYNPFTLRGGIREPFPAFSPDANRNRESARRLAALEPAVVAFGHGAPCTDPAVFAAAVAKLG